MLIIVSIIKGEDWSDFSFEDESRDPRRLQELIDYISEDSSELQSDGNFVSFSDCRKCYHGRSSYHINVQSKGSLASQEENLLG